MGLDMYLSANRTLYEFNPEQNALKQAIDAALASPLGGVTNITIEVGYWRKANAIHRWFVDNVQNGVDECQVAPVTHTHLEQLLITVDQVLENPDLAHELLPTATGSFFGGIEYNEYYRQDLQDTKEILEKVLKNDPGRDWNLYYQSSW